MIKKILKTILKVILVLIGMVVVGLGLLTFLMSYTSPVNEAGREYTANVKSYRNSEIKTIEDVYERLEVLKTHYNSTTFDKVQGGDRTEVTLSDIETMFGDPQQIHEEMDMSVADTVYQYHYDDITLNIHKEYFGVEEYVLEDFTGVLYEAQMLDQLFMELLQEDEESSNEAFKLVSEKDWLSSIDYTPTRETQQYGWVSRLPGPRYYFDVGGAEHSPEEYLLVQFEENMEGNTELIIMERRYHEVYSEKETEEEIEQKEVARTEFMNLFDDEMEETILVEDLMNVFGDIAMLYYDFRYDTLEISWIILGNDEWTEEIKGEVPITTSNKPSSLNDLKKLEVENLKSTYLYEDNRKISTDEFIGSE
jgi:hypothetical protein